MHDAPLDTQHPRAASAPARAAIRLTGLRALRGLAPVLLLLAVVLADLLIPGRLHAAPVMAAVPVLAAMTLPVWATAVLACTALAATGLLQWSDGLWGRPASDMTLMSVSLVALVGLGACALRRSRERELRQVRSVAEAAQRALLHPLPRRLESLELCGVYLPAEAEARIGGDFYEALPTPHGIRVLIGDVRGKGLPAVGASAALLGAFRELAYREASLAGLARGLDESAGRQIATMEEGAGAAEPRALFTERFATALLVEVPRDEPVARFVHCGHPEPLTIRAGRVHGHVAEPPGAPLGLGDLIGTPQVEQTVPFAPGDRLVLYTDGFIETRDRDGRFHDLAARARIRATQPLAALVTGLRADLLKHADGDLDDDAALLVLERGRAGEPGR
ncbi:PP2C family protein-serine/threonine phosphatase [Streptomyces glaucus]|uniref:PP2C family protein-serine/threonine phosphatase n=1 Tax=Streptomyces glaucus TaxID=284029 RepID=A0ABN3KDD7_9ACTN